MEFFSKAKERGWECEEIVTERFPVCDHPLPTSVTDLYHLSTADVPGRSRG